MARKIMRYTKEHLEFIEANQSGISRQELAEKFTEKFGVEVTWRQMRTICYNKGWKNGIDTRFKKGLTPYFKGTRGIKKPTSSSFKKGMIPKNKKPIGSTRLSSTGYTLVKVAEPDVYELKQRVVWKKHNGDIPDDCCVRFIDNDKANFSIDNLILVPKSVNAIVNLRHKADTSDSTLNKVILKTEHLSQLTRRLSNG